MQDNPQEDDDEIMNLDNIDFGSEITMTNSQQQTTVSTRDLNIFNGEMGSLLREQGQNPADILLDIEEIEKIHKLIENEKKINCYYINTSLNNQESYYIGNNVWDILTHRYNDVIFKWDNYNIHNIEKYLKNHLVGIHGTIEMLKDYWEVEEKSIFITYKNFRENKLRLTLKSSHDFEIDVLLNGITNNQLNKFQKEVNHLPKKLFYFSNMYIKEIIDNRTRRSKYFAISTVMTKILYENNPTKFSWQEIEDYINMDLDCGKELCAFDTYQNNDRIYNYTYNNLSTIRNNILKENGEIIREYFTFENYLCKETNCLLYSKLRLYNNIINTNNENNYLNSFYGIVKKNMYIVNKDYYRITLESILNSDEIELIVVKNWIIGNSLYKNLIVKVKNCLSQINEFMNPEIKFINEMSSVEIFGKIKQDDLEYFRQRKNFHETEFKYFIESVDSTHNFRRMGQINKKINRVNDKLNILNNEIENNKNLKNSLVTEKNNFLKVGIINKIKESNDQLIQKMTNLLLTEKQLEMKSILTNNMVQTIWRVSRNSKPDFYEYRNDTTKENEIINYKMKDIKIKGSILDYADDFMNIDNSNKKPFGNNFRLEYRTTLVSEDNLLRVSSIRRKVEKYKIKILKIWKIKAFHKYSILDDFNKIYEVVENTEGLPDILKYKIRFLDEDNFTSLEPKKYYKTKLESFDEISICISCLITDGITEAIGNIYDREAANLLNFDEIELFYLKCCVFNGSYITLYEHERIMKGILKDKHIFNLLDKSYIIFAKNTTNTKKLSATMENKTEEFLINISKNGDCETYDESRIGFINGTTSRFNEYGYFDYSNKSMIRKEIIRMIPIFDIQKIIAYDEDKR